MDMMSGAMLMAVVALAMGVSALGVFWYLRRDRAETSGEPTPAPAAKPESPPEPASASSGPTLPEPEQVAERFRVAKGAEVRQCLFVVLDWPGLDTNRRLRRKLEEVGAAYDPKQRVYNVHPPRTGYRMVIANSTPPGALPPLHEDGEHPVVDGISILVHFRNKRRVAHSPDALIDFTRSVAALGGRILDAERQEVGDEEFEQLRRAAP
ncbi:cell division protein ZipA C-terminal FtsZ-binding domain-containing protein [Halomonas sp. HG01]|uniref:cell division protein ZipA C-terminal FtsZ-binding domain-containing protein n=2 Tax=unclassified Halomonas TaxID=2609666 RepID=UPI0006147DF5|nr:cell division protein ZipA C-terminal FtsZ-binding domain-containing protein [Halomonas sp. HG01]RAH39544.1 hypothetical protein C9J49_000160 [Halomonas sp. SL1]